LFPRQGLPDFIKKFIILSLPNAAHSGRLNWLRQRLFVPGAILSSSEMKDIDLHLPVSRSWASGGRRLSVLRDAFMNQPNPFTRGPVPFAGLFLGLFLLMLPSQGLAALAASAAGGPRPLRPNPEILKGIDLIYERQFTEAEEVFRRIIDRQPDEPAGHFYLAMVSWSRLAAGFWSPESVKTFERRIDRAIEAAQAQIENHRADSYDFFYLGGALGFKGRFELMKDNWISSFFLAKDAVDSLKTCIQMDPDNKDVLFGIGTFDYYTARFSGIKKFLAYLLLHEGNKEEGLRKLSIASKEALYSATEAKSMLLHIYLFFEAEYAKALDLAGRLAEQYAHNPRFKVLEGVAYVRLGMDEGYRETVRELRRRAGEARNPREAAIWERKALYLESIYDLYHGRSYDARCRLEEILDQPDPEADPAMIAWPLLKIGMSYDLENKRNMAVSYYKKVLNMENGAGAQVLAERFLESPPGPGDPFLGY